MLPAHAAFALSHPAGTKATELMWELKELFDPDYILNPGVILNKDPLVRRQRVLAGAIM